MTEKTLIDFNDLPAGTVIDGQYSAQGVTISSLDPHRPAMIFDTAHPTGGDSDLASSNLGGVLIASEDGDSTDPDDNAGGAQFKFAFDAPATVHSLTFLDIEEGASVKLYDAHGNLIDTFHAQTADNGQTVLHMNVDEVAFMVVELCGSGAVDNLSFTAPAAGGDGIVDGTDQDDVIDLAYIDAQGDRIDANDAQGVMGTVGDDDLVYAGAGDDIVKSAAGDDIVFGGDGADTITGGDGADTIDAGNDDDLILGATHGDHIDGGSRLSGGSGSGSGSGSGAASDFDTLDLTGLRVEIEYAPDTEDEDGTIFFLDESGIRTGKTATFEDIEKIVFDPFVPPQPDGIVEGTEGADVIDAAYDGDPNGDFVDAGDALLPGEVGDDDIILAKGGDDSVLAGAGDDLVSAGAGDDTVDAGAGADEVLGEAGADEIAGGTGDDTLSGGAGDDTVAGGDGDDLIYGDTGGERGAPICGPRESFNWAQVPGYGDGVAVETAAQNTGTVEVSFTTTRETGDVVNAFEASAQNVTGIQSGPEAVDADASFESVLSSPEEAGAYRVAFSQPVCDVSFNINDVDGDGVVTVRAYDEFGQELPVTLEGGSGVSVTGSTIDSKGGYAPDSSDAYSTTVAIAGPVARIEITHDQDGANDSGINITDIFFSPVIGYEPDPAGSGADSLLGGAGLDTIFGEAGDDTLDGGAGADEMSGGDDRDSFINVTPGDVIDGGEGGDDFDTLDLTGANATFELDAPGAESGTVIFLGDDGTPTGETARFVNIETVIGGVDPRDGIVEGTEGGDLIDAAYDGDPNGDFVDAGDALLPGEVGDDDIILAKGGDDTVLAGAGDDEVDAGEGDDSVLGGAGDDSLLGGGGNDTLEGEAGDDTLRGGAGDDSLLGGAGDDLITGKDGKDTLDGGDGDDTLLSGFGDDSIIGGAGNDFITGNGGNDTIDAGITGRPDLGYPGLFAGDDDPDDDRDYVEARGGSDFITTGDDDDTINGGSGRDTIDAGFDRDLVFGDDGNDSIIGGEGSDTIFGGSGNDTIYGGLGGDPALDPLNIPDDIDLVPDNGRDVIDGGVGNDLIFGQDDDDSILGGEGDDTIDGGIDEDTIDGGAGDDSLLGGAGADSILGGAGMDTIVSGAGADEAFGGDDQDLFLGASAGDFIDGGEGGVDQDTLDLTGIDAEIEKDADNAENGVVFFLDGDGNRTGETARFENIETVIPCFTPGTLIATPRGEVPVEALEPGDRVITRDNGIQVVRWTGRRDLTRAEMAANGALRAVRIAAGALGHGLPERDMTVSPQHRVLIANDETMLYFDEREVLVAAKHLVGRPGITRAEAEDISYIHVMFDNHEVILSNGAWTESFQPGDHSLKGLGAAQREEIFAIFPDLRDAEGRAAYAAARRMLKRREAELLRG
ncbi:Hint domain-containing protein [Jannaschia ovalis]|uniref:Hint domain-containing protein n=1 Tax=Jannaschia ovalis TaxID=3038773 RepID=A0ABY8LAX9_9RHOB|nr:Hint domain-containing protein [Jannaschia sp. GRR-S6-38]WGH78491.1 Hint domain-containing protein [Jannaschia sp. GRR-S6-38]